MIGEQGPLCMRNIEKHDSQAYYIFCNYKTNKCDDDDYYYFIFPTNHRGVGVTVGNLSKTDTRTQTHNCIRSYTCAAGIYIHCTHAYIPTRIESPAYLHINSVYIELK